MGSLGAAEIELVGKVRDQYDALKAVDCTGCGYCMPCPNGVDIPRNFSIVNNGLMFGSLDEARQRYVKINKDQDPKILGSSCIQCLECEDKCPQSIHISEWMPYLHQVLAEGKAFDPKAVS